MATARNRHRRGYRRQRRPSRCRPVVSYRSQPVKIRHGQLPHVEVEDGSEQELEEEDCPSSACHRVDDRDQHRAFACGEENLGRSRWRRRLRVSRRCLRF